METVSSGEPLPSESIHVLHVDDEPDFADLAATFLQRKDGRLDVTTKTNADDALDHLADHPVHCVVSDYDMPGENGIEFLDSVREEYPDLPFILYTGKGSEEVASEAISAGVTDYLQKEGGTSQYDVLANRIVNSVNSRRTRNELERQNQAFDAFFDIVNDSTLSFEKRLSEVLSLGVEFLNLDNGIISNIDPPEYTVEHVVTPDESIEQGAVLDFNDTFCELVYESDGPVAFRSPEAGDVEDHPCYQDLGLEAYLGEPLIVDGERYGTLNFSSPEPRAEPFTEGERAFIRTMSGWVTRELSRQRREREVERYDTVLEAVSDGVYIIDSDGYYTYVNSYVEEKTGYSKAELVGSTPRKVIPDEDVNRFEAAIGDLLGGHQDTFTAETRVQPKEGDPFPVEIKLTVLTDEDGFLERTVGIVRDITERKEQEWTLERLHGATREMMDATSTEAVVRAGSGAAEEVLGLPMHGIHLYDPDEDALVPVAWTETGEQVLGNPPPAIPVGDSLAGRVYLTGEPAIHADIRGADETLNPETPFRSELILPLGEHGVLIAGSTAPDDFTASDASLARVLTANIEAALDRVEREKRLDRQQSLLAAQQEAVLDGVLVTDEDRQIISYNDRFVDMWEVPEELVEQGDDERVIEAAIDQFANPDEFLDTVDYLYDHPEETVQDELELTDGGVIERYTTPLHGEDGTLYGRLWTFRDITEHKDRLREIERERNRFEALFETVPDPTVHVVFEGSEPVIQHVNDAFEEVFGYGSEEARGESLDDLIVPVEKQEAAADINEFVREEGLLQREIRRETVTGERPFLFTAQTMELGDADSDRVEGVGTYVDLTEQKRRENELARQNERLDEFASVLSHDLRNPLNVADGRLELAREACESDHLDAVAGALDRIEELIDDTLTLARQGDQVSEFEPIDLGELASDCWRNVDTAEATLVTETDLTIRADRSRLQQVLENLFRNAVDHGGTDVEITVGVLDDEAGLYVSDDGPGIPTDKHREVFEPGYTSSESGTGFGLSIVTQIAEAHGWTIDITSSKAGGARFEITGVEFAK